MPPTPGCPRAGLAYPEVTRASCLVPSASFSQAPRYALPVHLCRFRVRSIRWRCFPGRFESRANPIRPDNTSRPSRPAGPGLFARFPSTTAFALALGAGSPRADEPCAGTLGLPATGILAPFVATHVSIRTPDTSRAGHPYPFDGLRDAPLPRTLPSGCVHPRLRHVASDPLHLRRGVSVRPVSYYAFFKGWLLLSQPPGCRGVPTSFPT